MYIGFIDDKDFGKVLIYTRRGMCRVKVEYDRGRIIMHVPEGMPVRTIASHIDNMRPQIAKLRTTAEANALRYSPGQVIQCLNHTVTIGANSPRKRNAHFGERPDGSLFVDVPEDSDFTRDGVTATISACLKRLMSDRAEQCLIPLARAVACEKGVKPREFVVGRGMRKLGHCTADGTISLSYILMFYPEDLVRYVVCHELAHLAVFNHSRRFHEVCNRLCDGRERELEAMLRKFRPPLLK